MGRGLEASSVGCQWVYTEGSPVSRVKVSGGSALAQRWPMQEWPVGRDRSEGVSMPTDWLSTPQLHSRVWGGSAELGGRSAGSSNRDPV